MTAHLAGVPVEEALLPLAGGAGAGLLLVRAWFATRVRPALRGARRRRPGFYSVDDEPEKECAWHRSSGGATGSSGAFAGDPSAAPSGGG